MLSGEHSIPVKLHHSGLWVGIGVTVGSSQDLLMVLDPGAPVSAISPRMRQELHNRDLLQPATEPRYLRLAQLVARDAPGVTLPDVTVRVLPRLALLRIDGLLGLDFFRQFARVCFHISESRLMIEHAAARS